MFFNKKYLTTAGKNLLDQVVAGDTIVWKTCATSSLSYVSDDTARALTDIAVDGKYTSFGNVEKVVSSDNGNLVITCRVTNQSNSDVEIESGEARAFGVWAKREEDETFTLVIVAFWHLDEGSPETIPEQTQSFDATVDLYVKTSDNVISTIESNPSWMTSVDTFNSFKDSINNDLSDLNDFKDRATADLTALNNFKDSVNDDLNDLKDRVVTTHSANSTSTGDTQTIKGIKTFDDYTYFNSNTIATHLTTNILNIHNYVATSNITTNGILNLEASEICIDTDTDTLVISSPNNRNLEISATCNIGIRNYIEMYNGLYVEGTLSAIENFSCGGNSNFMSEITADSGITSHGDIIVDNGKKFKGNLDGVIPYVERDSFAEDHIVPVGCIVFLKIKDITSDKMWATYNPYEIGTEFTREDNSTMDIRIGGFGESGMLEDADAPELVGRQTFRTLSRCEFSENGVAYVLAIRVE